MKRLSAMIDNLISVFVLNIHVGFNYDAIYILLFTVYFKCCRLQLMVHIITLK